MAMVSITYKITKQHSSDTGLDVIVGGFVDSRIPWHTTFYDLIPFIESQKTHTFYVNHQGRFGLVEIIDPLGPPKLLQVQFADKTVHNIDFLPEKSNLESVRIHKDSLGKSLGSLFHWGFKKSSD